MLTRTTKGIGEATSSDGGKTWQKVQTLPGIQTTAVRFHVTRLKSGRLLLVYNDNPKFRGNMTAALSEDDGRTWTAKLLLDDAVTSPIPTPNSWRMDRSSSSMTRTDTKSSQPQANPCL